MKFDGPNIMMGIIGIAVLTLVGSIALEAIFDGEPQVAYEDENTICTGYYPTECRDKETGQFLCSYQYGRGPGYNCRETNP